MCHHSTGKTSKTGSTGSTSTFVCYPDIIKKGTGIWLGVTPADFGPDSPCAPLSPFFRDTILKENHDFGARPNGIAGLKANAAAAAIEQRAPVESVRIEKSVVHAGCQPASTVLSFLTAICHVTPPILGAWSESHV